jgi:hypothetical protein
MGDGQVLWMAAFDCLISLAFANNHIGGGNVVLLVMISNYL